ncbi:MAG: radical SAM protein [Theionarchaea archaeon]|nr:MAG: radical SAM protein [Theionarchaea archaeon DG-70]MBU7011183.1 radical SAM protein [Theionarchaea archaeon]
MLLKKTKSLCPVCLKVIEADITEEDGKVMLEKTCKEHGFFKDIYWSDVDLYKRAQKFIHEGKGLDNPMTTRDKGCPYDCGICNEHKTTTILANIDLTNRCNMHCPICFADTSSEYLYEPSYEEIVDMLINLRSEKPVPCKAVQFSGGEPTVRKDLPEIIKKARELGFMQVQIATNGLKLAESTEYCQKLRDAGLNTVYLQFDGITPEVYEKTRGFNAWPLKQKAIKNCEDMGATSICLVPTLVKGINDHQVGDIIKYAFDHRKAVRAVNFQPVSFAGRLDYQDLMNMRITIPDFVKLVEEQTDGQVAAEDFYTVPSVVPVSRFVEALTGRPQIEFTCHFACGTATYVFKDGDRLIPIAQFIDVEEMMNYLDEISQNPISWWKKPFVGMRLLTKLRKCIDNEKKPEYLNIRKLLMDILVGGKYLDEFSYEAVLIGCMHFQDGYNFDIERVQRCAIHYALPGGRIIPFCPFNTVHRKAFETEYARQKGTLKVREVAV